MKTDPAVKTWYGLVATVGTIGTYSKMPGTLGTLVAAAALAAAGGIPRLAVILAIFLGTVASDLYAKKTGKDDPGEVVIDEVAGYWVSLWGLDPSYAVVGFILFRLVDILKPFPVRNMEVFPGGIGIMADDICGGVMVNLLMRLLHWLFFAGGFSVLFGALGVG